MNSGRSGEVGQNWRQQETQGDFEDTVKDDHQVDWQRLAAVAGNLECCSTLVMVIRHNHIRETVVDHTKTVSLYLN